MVSLVDFVLTSVNSEFMGVSMKIAIRGLSRVILISGPGRDNLGVEKTVPQFKFVLWTALPSSFFPHPKRPM